MNKTELEQVLDERVRPDLSLHGGNVRIERLKDQVLYVRLTGQCSGCPAAGLTMETLIESELKATFAELKQVVLVSGVSDGMIEAAKTILKKRKSEREDEQ